MTAPLSAHPQTPTKTRPSPGSRTRAIAIAALACTALAGCEEGQGFEMPAFLQPAEAGSAEGIPARSTRLVERDVEAPEVFQVTEPGLWDGRPSLGGVWVAHPDVKDPERVIIRNTDNGTFVIGALFRKERATPGPRLQVSSDAAAALTLVAGQPTTLNVTALRRETAPETPAAAPQSTVLDAPDGVTAAPLDADNTAPTSASDIATAALDATEPGPAAAASTATTAAILSPAATAASAATSTPASNLDKPFIQIGIFSVEQNAKNTAAAMRTVGLVPTIKPGTSSGKSFWRVVVGPATSAAERAELLKTIKAQGFEDAYAVTN